MQIQKIALFWLFRRMRQVYFSFRCPLDHSDGFCKQILIWPEPSVQHCRDLHGVHPRGGAWAGPLGQGTSTGWATPKLQVQVISVFTSGPVCVSSLTGKEIGDMWLAQLLKAAMNSALMEQVSEHMHLYCRQDPNQTMKVHGRRLVGLLTEAMFSLAGSAFGVTRPGKKR